MENQTPFTCVLFHTENVFNFFPISSRRKDGFADFQRKPVKPLLIYRNHGRPTVITEKVYLYAPPTPHFCSLCTAVLYVLSRLRLRWNISISDWHRHQKSEAPDTRSCRTVLDKLQLKSFWGGWIY